MKRGDMVKIDAGNQSFFALHEENTWKIVEGAIVRGEDTCLVLQVKKIKMLGSSFEEIKVLTPRGQVGWLTNQYIKLV
jgi:hypothetical protein